MKACAKRTRILRAFGKFAAWLSSARRRMLPPAFAAMELATGLWPSLALRAAVVSGVLDALHGGPLSPNELAVRLQLHAPSLSRLLRLLAAYDIVRERRGGRFTLTRIGAAAASREHGNVAAFIRYLGEPWQLQPWANLHEALKDGRPAFESMYGAPFFSYAREHPDVGRIFDDAMDAVAQLHVAPVMQAYEFAGIGSIVDVGGGKGQLLEAILQRYPQIDGTLFDLAHVTAPVLRLAQAGQTRMRVESGDMFSCVPAGADAYILGHILHDWDDDRAARILSAVREAMHARSRIVVIESVLQSGNRWEQAKLSDIQMLAVLSGRERTREEFISLFARCGLAIRRVIHTAAAECVLEVIAPSRTRLAAGRPAEDSR